jgi:hypothetical protein
MITQPTPPLETRGGRNEAAAPRQWNMNESFLINVQAAKCLP